MPSRCGARCLCNLGKRDGGCDGMGAEREDAWEVGGGSDIVKELTRSNQNPTTQPNTRPPHLALTTPAHRNPHPNVALHNVWPN